MTNSEQHNIIHNLNIEFKRILDKFNEEHDYLFKLDSSQIEISFIGTNINSLLEFSFAINGNKLKTKTENFLDTLYNNGISVSKFDFTFSKQILDSIFKYIKSNYQSNSIKLTFIKYNWKELRDDFPDYDNYFSILIELSNND